MTKPDDQVVIDSDPEMKPFVFSSNAAPFAAASAGLAWAAPERDPDQAVEEELERELEEEFHVPAAVLKTPRDMDPDIDEEAPRYGDLLDTDWIERAAQVEDIDDERGGALDVGMTLDVSDAYGEDDASQVVDLDVGPLLTLITDGGDTDRELARDHTLMDSTFGNDALSDLLLTEDGSDPGSDEEIGDDERFPALDEPMNRDDRPAADDPSDEEGIAGDDA